MDPAEAAKGAMAKFRAECSRTVNTGSSAIRTSAAMAYRYLASQIELASSREDVLRATGLLASHHCESSVEIGTYLSTSGSFVIDVYDGTAFQRSVLALALHIVGEADTVQEGAEEASVQVNDITQTYSNYSINEVDIMHVLGGATGTENVSYQTGSYVYTNKLNSLMVYHSRAPIENVRSYLKGQAAYCVFTIRSKVEAIGGLLNVQMKGIQSRKVRADALGRLHVEDSDMMVNNETLVNASTITLSQLGGTFTGDSSTDCLQFMRTMFPEHVDAARFDATVHDSLYSRLKGLVNSTREGVATAVLSSPIREVLHDPKLVANDVAIAGFRIAGAPRGSWAGIARSIPDPPIANYDGLFVMALKQSRTLFLDRVVDLALKNADPCDHPPLASSASLNGYIIPLLRCSVLFLGMAHRPWIDAQYDDESLMSRGIWVLAHELGHLTLNTYYIASEYNRLLKHYRQSTYVEAIADVVGAIGVINTGLVSRDRLIDHFCQLWCARTPLGWTHSINATHPQNNERCNFLNATLVENIPV